MAMTEAGAVTDAQVLALCDQLLSECDPRSTRPREFLGRQFDLGLGWVHFPPGHGGLGASPRFQRIINERLFAAGAPNPVTRNPIGHGMCAPTIATHGSEAQQARYLRPLFTSEEVWCQMFSEPGAGSDVAGLSTRAVRDGDEWIVNGQKVWTTLAHLSRWGVLLARTDPNADKHKGLSYFVIDMEGPGVDVRPLRQMTGEAEFNEVYFTDARIPDRERMGDVGDGWRVAITTLMNERVSIGGSIPPRGSGPIADALAAWKDHGHDDPARRDELMRLWIEAEISRLTNIRASQNRKSGTPGPEGSIGKLHFAELNKRITAFTVGLMGPEGQLYDSYAFRRPEVAMGNASLQARFLRARANSIEGGTSEVMRNILGERTLGLPGDIRVDKDKPWIEVPRN